MYEKMSEVKKAVAKVNQNFKPPERGEEKPAPISKATWHLKLIGIIILGIVVFVAFFLIAQFGPHLLPGDWIIANYFQRMIVEDWFYGTHYSIVTEGIINGIFYLVITYVIVLIIVIIRRNKK